MGESIKLAYVSIEVSPNKERSQERVVPIEAIKHKAVATYTNDAGIDRRLKLEKIGKVDSKYTNHIGPMTSFICFHMYVYEDDIEESKKLLRDVVKGHLLEVSDRIAALQENFKKL